MMEEEVSKSQKKRDAEALKKLGRELIELPLTKLMALPLSDELRQAILDAKSIKAHGAHKRQVQLIGKFMRNADAEAIVAEYEALKSDENAQTATFHALEQWRDRFLQEDKEALTEFVAANPSVDVQQLRMLIKKAITEKTSGQSLGASKALFRFLRSLSS